MKRDLLEIRDLSGGDILGLIAHGISLKNGSDPYQPLSGKTLAMIFAKASTRTRVSFEVGMFQLGGHALMLPVKDSQLGRGEPISDTAQVLSRYVDGIMIRTYSHTEVEELARYAQVPVINGLTDRFHPCQVLADLMTCAEEFGADRLTELVVTWVGDGNNMAHSWIAAAEVLGFELRLACPNGYKPDQDILDRAEAHGARVVHCPSVTDAALGAHVVTTDVWASMGQEEEMRIRKQAFAQHCVDSRVMAQARSDAIFLHCLPAHRGEEVLAEVIDGPQSRIFDEAENRLHIQKAILDWSIGNCELPT